MESMLNSKNSKKRKGLRGSTQLVTLMSKIGNAPTESLDLAEIDSPLGKVFQKLVANVCSYCES